MYLKKETLNVLVAEAAVRSKVVVLLLLIHCLLLLHVPLFVGILCHCLVACCMQYVLVLQSSLNEVRADCFTLIVSLM